MGERVTLTPPTFITGRDELALPGSHIKKQDCVHACACGCVRVVFACLCVSQDEGGKLGVYYHSKRLIIDSSRFVKPATMSLNAGTQAQLNDSKQTLTAFLHSQGTSRQTITNKVNIGISSADSLSGSST